MIILRQILLEDDREIFCESGPCCLKVHCNFTPVNKNVNPWSRKLLEKPLHRLGFSFF